MVLMSVETVARSEAVAVARFAIASIVRALNAGLSVNTAKMPNYPQVLGLS